VRPAGLATIVIRSAGSIGRRPTDRYEIVASAKALTDSSITSTATPTLKRKSREWSAERSRLLGQIEEHQRANESYLTEGVRLLELAKRLFSVR
jgi:hypothetical protein